MAIHHPFDPGDERPSQKDYDLILLTISLSLFCSLQMLSDTILLPAWLHL